MHASIRRALSATALTGGLAVAGLALAGAAHADATSGQDGLLSGNQSAVSVDLPVTVTGNQVTVLGHDDAVATTPRPAPQPAPQPAPAASPTTSGAEGAASGNQTAATVSAPVDVTGNQVVVAGDDNTTRAERPDRTAPASSDGTSGTTSGADGAASGNQTAATVSAPVDVTGNQVVVAGDDNTSTATSTATTPTAAPGTSPADGGDTTTGQDGLASGNQSVVGPDVPVTACGTQVVVLGSGSSSSCVADPGSGTPPPSDAGDTTTGQDGLASGNQTDLDATTPIGLTGNQVVVLGDGNTTARDTTPTAGEPDPGQPGTPGTPRQVGTPDGTDGTDGTPTTTAGTTTGGELPQAAPASSDQVLPSTGMSGPVLLAPLGLLLLLLGAALVVPAARRRSATHVQERLGRAILRA